MPRLVRTFANYIAGRTMARNTWKRRRYSSGENSVFGQFRRPCGEALEQRRVLTATIDSLSADPVNENDVVTLTVDFSNADTANSHDVTVGWDDPNDALDSTFSLPATASLNVGDSYNSSTDTAVLSITSVNTATGQVGFQVGHQYLDDGISPGNDTLTDDSTVTVSITETGPVGATFRVSVDSAGNEANANSGAAGLSEDGRFIAFHSNASNLVAGDTNGATDIFVHDRQTGQTTRVSVNSAGEEANSVFGSSDPSISADGRYVAFISNATNLVPGDTNNIQDVFVHDRQTGQTERVSVSSSGNQVNGGTNNPTISADGRYVTFASTANNLVVGDTNGFADVFVHDRQTGQTSRVSVDSAGNQGNNGSEFPVISGDGRFVAFQSRASNWFAGDTSATDIFVHDRQTGQLFRVGIRGSRAAISHDGNFVAFQSDATNLVSGDTNGFHDVFVYDFQTGQTSRVSVDSNGNQAVGNDSLRPSISSDGRFVSFVSHADNLVSGDTNNQEDIFVHDRQTGETIRASVESNGNEANHWSTDPSISADGQFVAYTSFATNLASGGDTNGTEDIFLSTVVLSGSSSTPAMRTFQQGDSNSYSGTTDHWINGEAPDTDTTDTHGENFVLVDGITGGGDILRQGLLKFDNIFGTGASRIPPGSTITDATLTLWVVNNGDSGEILRLLTEFNEGVPGVAPGDTWNDWGDGLNGHNLVPGIQATGTDPEAVQLLPLSESMFAPVPTAPLTIDVTSSLQFWSDNPGMNHGWMFREFDGNGWDFRASEHPSVSERPLLAVEFENTTDGNSVSVSIANVPPTLNAGGDETIGLDGVFNRVINFSDPGLLDVHAATVRFNDGNPAETIPIPLGDRTFTLDHTFPGAGSYTVEIDLEDDDSPPVTASFLVDVACSLTVTNTNDTGFGSLRGAIDCANLSAGTNTIDFAIPGAGPHLIQPQSALPEITDAVIIDGYTQPGAVANTAARAEGSNAVLQIVLDGSQAGANANGLTITSGGSTVAGLVIQNFEGSGIELTSVAGNHISGNFIGTDVGGNASLGNLANGIRINASSSASGGAFTETSFEDVASSQDASGIRFDDYFPHPGGNLTSFGSVSSTVFTNPTTTEAPFGLVSNGFFADGTSFFDTVDIAGGGLYGAPSIVEWTFVDPVTYVPQAVEAVAFRYGGLFAPLQAEFFDASDNQIATLDLEIDDYTSNNPVTSTSSAGFVSVDNPISKIVFSGTHPTAPQFLLGSFSHSTALLDAVVSNGFSTPNIIGTDGDGINDVAEMNVIGGSGLQNVLIFGSSSNTVIAGNLIGANASGDSSLINADVGIDISDGSGRSRIGTDGNGISDALEGNVISGNVTAGIRLRGTPDVTETIIAGNLIGTDATGTTPIANSGVGVQLSRATRTRIGTNGDGQSDAEERNVISGNTLDGVLISGLPLSGTSLGENVLAGNYIGVAADLSPLPNGTNGLRIGTDNSANRIGSNKDGTGDAAERNVIAHNGGTGILVDGATTGNTFAENSIFDNGLLGIDLGNDGTTLNDLGDTDAGPNQLQNFPVLSSAISVGGSTTISGTLDSVAGSSFTLEFFSSSFSDGTGFGEGENYVGSAIVTTNASGAANFNANFPVAIPLGHVVSATGTDMAGNTSEFSASVVIDDGDGISAGVEDGAPNGGDGNNDGTPDSQQSNVASLPNAIDGTYVTLQSPTGTDFGNVVANINPSPGDAPAGVDFPVGFFEFELSGITPGESTTVTLFLESGLMVNTYYKFGPEPGNAVDHWYEFLFDGTTGAEILTDRIVLHFVDGQRGDDDLFANGVIVEPGAPGFLQNNPPTVEANTDPVSVNEGDVAMNTGMFDDIDSSDNVTITASAGMITFQDTGNSGNWSWEFNSADGPIESQLVTITADDGNGGTAQANFQLNVVNLRPTVDSLSVPPDPIDFNDQVSSVVNVTFSDPGGPLDETYTCNFDMDGDSLYDMTVTGVTGTSCSTPLAYTEPGVYMVTVAVTDKDGGDSDPVTATEFIVIYDPNGGFVTGGGWIDSPANACPNFCDWAAGKASFGFVSKYHKGATVPTGRTEFQFNAGDLNFHSTSYDWLVIAGSKAIYKGDGRVNGVDGFSFQINAIDGQIKGGGGVDKFRIKIIEAGGGVIYDNQADAGDDDDPTTELGGGSIKIHK